MCETCSKLTIKIQERRQWRRSGIFIVNFEHISHLVLVFLLLPLNMQKPLKPLIAGAKLIYTICLSVFDHFVKLTLKGLRIYFALKIPCRNNFAALLFIYTCIDSPYPYYFDIVIIIIT